MKWESRKLNIVPGVARFQKTENRADKNLMIRLTKEQLTAIHLYCNNNNTTATDLIKSLISEHFKAVNFNPPGEQQDDPRQKKMF